LVMIIVFDFKNNLYQWIKMFFAVLIEIGGAVKRKAIISGCEHSIFFKQISNPAIFIGYSFCKCKPPAFRSWLFKQHRNSFCRFSKGCIENVSGYLAHEINF